MSEKGELHQPGLAEEDEEAQLLAEEAVLHAKLAELQKRKSSGKATVPPAGPSSAVHSSPRGASASSSAALGTMERPAAAAAAAASSAVAAAATSGAALPQLSVAAHHNSHSTIHISQTLNVTVAAPAQQSHRTRRRNPTPKWKRLMLQCFRNRLTKEDFNRLVEATAESHRPAMGEQDTSAFVKHANLRFDMNQAATHSSNEVRSPPQSQSRFCYGRSLADSGFAYVMCVAVLPSLHAEHRGCAR